MGPHSTRSHGRRDAPGATSTRGRTGDPRGPPCSFRLARPAGSWWSVTIGRGRPPPSQPRTPSQARPGVRSGTTGAREPSWQTRLPSRLGGSFDPGPLRPLISTRQPPQFGPPPLPRAPRPAGLGRDARPGTSATSSAVASRDGPHLGSDRGQRQYRTAPRPRTRWSRVPIEFWHPTGVSYRRARRARSGVRRTPTRVAGGVESPPIPVGGSARQSTHIVPHRRTFDVGPRRPPGRNRTPRRLLSRGPSAPGQQHLTPPRRDRPVLHSAPCIGHAHVVMPCGRRDGGRP